MSIVNAFALTAGMVAEATGGQLIGGSPDRPFETVSTNQDGQEVVRGTWTNIVRGV